MRPLVYGLPARVVGALLLQLAVFAVGDAFYCEVIRGAWDWPPWYTVARLGSFFGSICGVILLCLVYRQRR